MVIKLDDDDTYELNYANDLIWARLLQIAVSSDPSQNFFVLTIQNS